VAQYGDLPALGSELLRGLNKELEARTFLTGSSLTLADILAYAAVAPALVGDGLCGRWGGHEQGAYMPRTMPTSCRRSTHFLSGG
jgi:glutathione S-transferase